MPMTKVMTMAPAPKEFIFANLFGFCNYTLDARFALVKAWIAWRGFAVFSLSSRRYLPKNYSGKMARTGEINQAQWPLPADKLMDGIARLMKCVGVALAIASLIAGLVAAWYWYKRQHY